MRHVAFVRQRRRHPHWQALPQGRAPDRPTSPLLHLAWRRLRRREALLRQRDLARARRFRGQDGRRRPQCRRHVHQGRRDAPRGVRVMTPQRLMRRFARMKLAADRLAIDLILDCECAASGRNGKRADPARWTETDWRHYLRAAADRPQFRGSRRSITRSATSRPLFANVNAQPSPRPARSVAPIANS